MTSRVEKAGSLKFRPGPRSSNEARRIEIPSNRASPRASSIRASVSVEPLPIARRPSIGSSSSSGRGSIPPTTIGKASTSSLLKSPSAVPRATKSYAVGTPNTPKGGTPVPIFVGSGAHSQGQARGQSMGPPSIVPSRRSQTPQSSLQKSSTPVIESTPAPPPFYTSLGDGHSSEGRESEQQRSTRSNGRQPQDADSRQDQRREKDSRVTRHTRSGKGPSERGAVDRDVQPIRQDSEPPQDSNGKEKGKSMPRKPGKPPSAYVLFSKEVRPKLIEEAGTIEGASFNISARVREDWQMLPVEEKERFEVEAEERKKVWQSVMEDWNTRHADLSSSSTKASSRKRSVSRKPMNEESVPPAKDAFQLFKEAVPSEGETNFEQAWEALAEEEKQRYVLLAQEEEERYLAERQLWEQEQDEEEGKSKKKPRKVKKKTTSEDEAEYLAEVAQYGASLKSRRVDPNNTAMSDLSMATFKQGRASKRTFEMERKLDLARKTRQREIKIQRAARDSRGRQNQGRNEGAEGVESEEEEEAAAAATDEPEGQGEEATEEGKESEAQSDTESVGATSVASSHHHPLRDNRFTVQTRIVDGQIVLDESSLQQQRSNDASMDGLGQEYIDVNEDDRFVNSATYSKRVGTERWDARETQQFLKAVSMWGSDFEMISRMFPTRNRKQVRAKWRSMERTDSRSLDLAFRRKLPVDLEEYGLLAGVDLSGEAPKIEARVIKKAEEENEEEEGEGEEEKERNMQPKDVDYDENGEIIVYEKDGQSAAGPSSIRKKSATPVRITKSKSPGLAVESDVHEEEEEDEVDLPSTEELIRSGNARKERATSTTSNASHRPRSGSMSGANAAASERIRLEKKKQDLQRRERERLRRRSVPANEEEVIE